jgi:hypothetical protein
MLTEQIVDDLIFAKGRAAVAEIAALHDARVTELLTANTEYVEQARDARKEAASWRDSFQNMSVSFGRYIGARSDRAKRALAWGVDVFGLTSRWRIERAARFLEEALEVAHHEGIPAEVADALRVRVWSRPVGYLPREIGQAGLTLEVLAHNAGHELEEEIQREFERCMSSDPAEFRERHAAKIAAGLSFTGPLAPVSSEEVAMTPGG